jgi:hypothetical protein
LFLARGAASGRARHARYRRRLQWYARAVRPGQRTSGPCPARGFVATVGAAAAAWLTLASDPACAAVGAGFEARFATFQRAADGDGGAIDSAAGQFSTLADPDPSDPLLLACSRATIAPQAHAAMLPWKKLSCADERPGRIDKALALLQPAHDALLHRGMPTRLEARFVAANTFFGMPSMFNRGARGRTLRDQVLQHPQFAASPLPFRGTLCLRADVAPAADKRPVDAPRWFEQGVSRVLMCSPAEAGRQVLVLGDDFWLLMPGSFGDSTCARASRIVRATRRRQKSSANSGVPWQAGVRHRRATWARGMCQGWMAPTIIVGP